MARKHTHILDDIARIDAERDDPSADPSRYVTVEITAPVTEFGMRYSDTVVVSFEEGRFPAWFAPFRSWFRRLDLDPSYGFYVQRLNDDGSPGYGRYCAFELTALVLREPRYDTSMVERLAAAAKAAGWTIERVPGRVAFTGIED